MASVSSLGIGSGLDLNTLLDQLTTAENAPLTLLQNQQTAYQAKLSAYGTVQSVLSAFQSTASKLADATTFSSVKASVSNTAVMSVATSSPPKPPAASPKFQPKKSPEMTAPTPKDVICDPACGTAGFLIAASEHLVEHHSDAIYKDAAAKDPQDASGCKCSKGGTCGN